MKQRMGAGVYLVTTSEGTTKEFPAQVVQQMGVQIICNPFLLRLWPQNPENMTLIPVTFACNFPRVHSWRRMQLTSPHIMSLSMSLWYVYSSLTQSTDTASGSQSATTKALSSYPLPVTCPQA